MSSHTTIPPHLHSTSRPPLRRQNAFVIPYFNSKKVRAVPHTTKVTSSSISQSPWLPHGLGHSSLVPILRKEGGVECKRETTVVKKSQGRMGHGKVVISKLVEKGEGPTLVGLLTPARVVALNEWQKNTPRGYYVTQRFPYFYSLLSHLP